MKNLLLQCLLYIHKASIVTQDTFLWPVWAINKWLGHSLLIIFIISIMHLFWKYLYLLNKLQPTWYWCFSIFIYKSFSCVFLWPAGHICIYKYIFEIINANSLLKRLFQFVSYNILFSIVVGWLLISITNKN